MNDENPAPVDELERTDDAPVAPPAPEPRLPARAPLQATGGRPLSIIPRTFEEAYRIGKAAVVAKWVPFGWKDEMATMAIMHGAEVGLPPMMSLQKIAVINGRPSLWGDAVPAIALATGQLEDWEEGITGDGGEMAAFCRVKRRGIKTPMMVTFSVADAKLAGLWSPEPLITKEVWEGDRNNRRKVKKDNQPNDSPWHRHPKRMLQMRARRAFRDMFADAFSGLYLAEELMDEPAMRDVTPRAEDHERIDNPLGGDDEAAEPITSGIVTINPQDLPAGTTVMPTEAIQTTKAQSATKPPAARKNAQAKPAAPAQAKRPDDIVLGKPPRSTGADYLAYVQTWVAIAERFEEEGFLSGTYIRDRYAKEAGLRNNLGVPLTDEERSAVQAVCKAAVERIKARSNETAQPES